MTAAVEKMAYAGETPWHGLGFKVSNDLTPHQMLKAAHLDWTVSKHQLAVASGPFKGTQTDDYALIRDSDGTVLSTVGELWKPIQNEQVLEFFTKFVKAGHMSMETAGSLWGGRYVWALAKINRSFTLLKKDRVEGYLLLANPHVFGKQFVAKHTAIRVVCWNTYSAALAGASEFAMTHAATFDEKAVEKAEKALGLATEQMEHFQEAAELLAKSRAKPDEVNEFFREVANRVTVEDLEKAMKKAAENAKAEKEEAEEMSRGQRVIAMFKHALTHAPGQTLSTAEGTWWGAFNAVTYVVDHEQGKTNDLRLRSAFVGVGAKMKENALELSVHHAR